MASSDTETILTQIQQKIPKEQYTNTEIENIAKEILVLAEIIADAYYPIAVDATYESDNLHSSVHERTS